MERPPIPPRPAIETDELPRPATNKPPWTRPALFSFTIERPFLPPRPATEKDERPWPATDKLPWTRPALFPFRITEPDELPWPAVTRPPLPAWSATQQRHPDLHGRGRAGLGGWLWCVISQISGVDKIDANGAK